MQAFLFSYHHQGNGQVEACIKFVKCTLKKCFDSRGDPLIALLQMHMILLGQECPSPATILLSCPIMPIINGPPVGIDNDEKHHEVITKRQKKDNKNNGFNPHRIYCSSSMGRWGIVDPWHNRRKR